MDFPWNPWGSRKNSKCAGWYPNQVWHMCPSVTFYGPGLAWLLSRRLQKKPVDVVLTRVRTRTYKLQSYEPNQASKLFLRVQALPRDSCIRCR